MEDNLITYKFWKKFHNTAIYISACGGVATISQKGFHFRKGILRHCPAMKTRPCYPMVSLATLENNRWVCFNFYTHRAVAEVYLRPKNLFEVQVDHLDGNVMNFHVLNLEWVTHEENIRRAVEMRRKRKAEKGGVSK